MTPETSVAGDTDDDVHQDDEARTTPQRDRPLEPGDADPAEATSPPSPSGGAGQPGEPAERSTVTSPDRHRSPERRDRPLEPADADPGPGASSAAVSPRPGSEVGRDQRPAAGAGQERPPAQSGDIRRFPADEPERALWAAPPSPPPPELGHARSAGARSEANPLIDRAASGATPPRAAAEPSQPPAAEPSQRAATEARQPAATEPSEARQGAATETPPAVPEGAGAVAGTAALPSDVQTGRPPTRRELREERGEERRGPSERRPPATAERLTSETRPASGGVRTSRVVLRRISPWSVLKVSLLFYLSMFVVLLVAGILLWLGARSAGFIGNIESFMDEIGFTDFQFVPSQILRGSAIGGLVLVVAGTFGNILMAVLYNLIADVIGGFGITLAEDEPTRRRI